MLGETLDDLGGLATSQVILIVLLCLCSNNKTCNHSKLLSLRGIHARCLNDCIT